MIRSLYGKHNLSVLPDVSNLPIKINFTETSSERLILDSDHVWESNDGKELAFEEEVILSKLEKMHRLSVEVFWSCTTEKGRMLWK